jgi:hypothetical protein
MDVQEPVRQPSMVSWVRALISTAGILILLGIVPTVLVAWWFGPVAAAAFPLGFVGALLAAKDGDLSVVFRLGPVLVVGGTLSAYTGGSWWWVAVLAVMGALIGWLASFGRVAEIVKISLVVVAAGVHREAVDLPVFAAFMTIGFLLGLLLLRVTGPGSPPQRHVFEHVRVTNVVLVGVLSLGTAGVLAIWLTQSFDWTKALWIPLFFLVFLEFSIVDPSGSRAFVGSRMVGTVVGIAILLPLVRVLPTSLRGVVFLILLSAGLTLAEEVVWLSTGLITAAVLLVGGGGVDPNALEGQRIWATAIAMLLIGATGYATRWIRLSETSPPS